MSISTYMEGIKKYNYYVTATDKAGNESLMSEACEFMTKTPKIYGISPSQDTLLGAGNFDGSVSVLQDTYGCPFRLYVYYYQETTQSWVLGNKTYILPESYSVGTITQDVYMNIDNEGDSLKLKCVTEDEDGNTDEYYATYSVDGEAPRIPEDFSVTIIRDNVRCSWSNSVDDDCVRYYLLKKGPGEDRYTCIATFTRLNDNRYEYGTNYSIVHGTYH